MAVRQLYNNNYVGLEAELPATLPSGSRYLAEDTQKLYGYDSSGNSFEISSNVTNTSDLVNDGSNGVDPFITANDLPVIPEYTLSPISGTNTVDLLKDGTSVSQIDLTLYLDDTNLSRLVSGEVVGNDLIVTRDDSSTFTIDVSSLVGGGSGGDVFKVGTPVDNQIGVWTGDGTIEGDANLTWDGAKLKVAGNVIPTTDAVASFSYGSAAGGLFAGVESKQIGVEGSAAFHLTAFGSNRWSMSCLGSSAGGHFVVSNEYNATFTSRALLIDKNNFGILAPNTTIATIDAESTGKILTTKEWVENNAGGAFAVTTEGANTGIRRSGFNAGQFGNIGQDATDLSFSTGNSSTRGATGLRSATLGTDLIASGIEAVAIGTNGQSTGTESIMIGRGISGGFQSVAIGTQGAQATAGWATAMGARSVASGSTAFAVGTDLNSGNCVASGRGSVAIGGEIEAAGQHETALGRYSTQYTAPNPNGYNNLNRAFSVGIGDFTIGSGVKGRVDGVTMLWRGDFGIGINNFEANTTGERLQVNGLIKSDSTIAEIDAGSNKTVVTKEWTEDKFVTTDTPQNITAVKTFNQGGGLDFFMNSSVTGINLQSTTTLQNNLITATHLSNVQPSVLLRNGGSNGNLVLETLFSSTGTPLTVRAGGSDVATIDTTGKVTASSLNLQNLPIHADEAAANTAGLATGDVYMTATGELRIKL